MPFPDRALCHVGCFCFIGNYVLNYLATRPKLATFVTQALIQLYARITKLGWFDCQKDDYVFRNAITDVTRFLQDSVEYCIIGVTILSQLTNEINQVSATAFLIEVSAIFFLVLVFSALCGMIVLAVVCFRGK
ncbi:PREDICTED: exportin-7-like [Myotis davidii]|uniref:exportin-7-like n=1 Tax=Myotis davidii TaxID=225400 RepID=UPI0007674D51|nr:PREDICTED: exportin-7-like [Myotis davidii]